MYIPDHFAMADDAEAQALIAAHPLAALVTAGGDAVGGLEASHLPMLFDPSRGAHGVLQGHLARANPHWRRLGAQSEGLAIFTGPDAYISPGWYPTKAETGKVVPTWNYGAVHVSGRLSIHDDAGWLEKFLRKLTDGLEAELDQPWSVDDAPEGYIGAMTRGVVGLELEITRIEGKIKSSQNRPGPDRAGVARGLENRGQSAAASAVAKAR